MTTSKQPQPEAGPSKPAYQHRHRPDQPPPAGAAVRPGEVKRPFVRVASSEDAAARRMSAIMGDAAPPAIAVGHGNPQPNSGGSSTTLTEGVKARGGFNPQLAVSLIVHGIMARRLMSRNHKQAHLQVDNQQEPWRSNQLLETEMLQGQFEAFHLRSQVAG